MSHTMLWVVHEVAEGEILRFVGAARTDGAATSMAASDAAAQCRKMKHSVSEVKLDQVDHGEHGFELKFDHPAWEWHYTVCPTTIFEGP